MSYLAGKIEEPTVVTILFSDEHKMCTEHLHNEEFQYSIKHGMHQGSDEDNSKKSMRSHSPPPANRS